MDLNRFCKDVQLISNYPEYSNESPNLHVEVLEIPSHRYELAYTSVSIDRVKHEDLHHELWDMFESMRPGRPFRWKPPILSVIRGHGGNALAMETASGSIEIAVYNAPANCIWLKKGDLINFANQSKVYKVMADVQTTNSGMGTIQINCPLKKSLTIGTLVIGTGAEFTLIRRPKSKPQSFEIKGGKTRISYAKAEFIEFL